MAMAMVKKLICPRCHRWWAEFDFTRYPNLKASDLKVVAGQRKKVRDGDSLRCSLCGYEYLTSDIVLAGASPDPSESLEPGQESKC